MAKKKQPPPQTAQPAPQATLPFPETEVEAYGFIRQQLQDLGWLVKNPNLNTGGQV